MFSLTRDKSANLEAPWTLVEQTAVPAVLGDKPLNLISKQFCPPKRDCACSFKMFEAASYPCERPCQGGE